MQSKQRTTPVVPLNSIVVSNCNDSGPGSYRQAVADAMSGDTIDLTNTGCSLITLTTGDIITAVNDLTLQGPGALGLTISGGYAYRPLEHIGSGTISVNDISISDGKKYLADGGFGNASGGCVSSGSGVVSLDHAWVKYCDAESADTTTPVRGGAVFGGTGVVVINSIVSGSLANSTGTGAYGGGIYTPGYLTVAYSTIRGNAATSSASNRTTGGGASVGAFVATSGGQLFMKYSTVSDNAAGIGGGLYATGDAFITNSTISSNIGGNTGGIMLFNSGTATGPARLVSSTVSGNNSSFRTGGIYLANNDAQIYNSTIAFNTTYSSPKYGSGLAVMSANTVDLESVLISNNTTNIGDGNGQLIDDVGSRGTGASLTGANNLVYFPSTLATPGGTILLQNPLLKGLSSNGGLTQTHSLSPHSVALDVGNDVLGTASDQRGSGYARTLGSGTDIGAFEFDQSDVIFADGFDG
ncbi:MAG: choice-of-anchor Q domain-containing protein [Dokdonella sp.]